VEFYGGASYLRIDTSIDCNTESYRRFVFIDVALIILYQSIPLIWLYLLYSVKDSLLSLSNDMNINDKDFQLKMEKKKRKQKEMEAKRLKKLEQNNNFNNNPFKLQRSSSSVIVQESIDVYEADFDHAQTNQMMTTTTTTLDDSSSGGTNKSTKFNEMSKKKSSREVFQGRRRATAVIERRNSEERIEHIWVQRLQFLWQVGLLSFLSCYPRHFIMHFFHVFIYIPFFLKI
jgi:hypothetical protein